MMSDVVRVVVRRYRLHAKNVDHAKNIDPDD